MWTQLFIRITGRRSLPNFSSIGTVVLNLESDRFTNIHTVWVKKNRTVDLVTRVFGRFSKMILRWIDWPFMTNWCKLYHIRSKNYVFTAVCAKGMRKGHFTPDSCYFLPFRSSSREFHWLLRPVIEVVYWGSRVKGFLSRKQHVIQF